MKGFVRGLVMTLAVAGFLGVAGQSFAADKVECSLMKAGKTTTKMVASKMACKQMGGKVVEAKAKRGDPKAE